MEYEFAPLEGITDAVYRRTHARFFPGIVRYYTPFISPTQHHRLTPRDRREIDPENNPGLTLIPQLLGKNAGDFLWAANTLRDMGYEEVNLNLGCPSGTVTAKGKGSGLLASPDVLERFLEEIFASSPLSISIKTRLGYETPDEFARLLRIYGRFPVSRLIVHARTRREMYAPGVHWDAFAEALNTDLPLTYNGDLSSPSDVTAFRQAFPTVDTVMIGRGLIADPALVAKLLGRSSDKATIRRFHDALCLEYPIVFGNSSSAAHRMKAIWHYMLYGFEGGEAYRKKLIKAKRWEDYLRVTDEIFDRLELCKIIGIND